VKTAIDATLVATEWLAGFEEAVNAHDASSVAGLFSTDGSWRDILALCGQIRNCDSPDRIEELLLAVWSPSADRRIGISGVVKAERLRRYDEEVIEAFFNFTTQVGHGQGIVRIRPGDVSPAGAKAWMLFTALRELDPLSRSGAAETSAHIPDRETGNWNWTDQRRAELEYADRDPEVLVVGAGQHGLSVAAQLRALRVDTLVVERWPRVGDNWRNRYQALRLHNDTRANHLPFLPFPPTWGPYPAKDQLGTWFEFYAEALELNVWTSTEFAGAARDDNSGRWQVSLRRDGQDRVLRPRHIVVCTGVSGAPRSPQLPGLDRFCAPVIHSTAYTVGEPFAGQRVLVVGSGVSAHDICQDLDRHGAAEITMMQRSSTMVISVEPGCQEIFSLYTKGDRPTEESDLLNTSITYVIQKKWLPSHYRHIAEMDKEILDGLHAAGFETNQGFEGLGYSDLYKRRGGGYYMDIGGSNLIIEGRIKLIHFRDLETFSEYGITMADGTTRHFDAVILATGYMSIGDNVARDFGQEIAERVGPVWGLDEEGELRNICRRTGQDGLWFMCGSFPDARIYSHYLALQIKADQEGVVL
jgi:hypothetical protein